MSNLTQAVCSNGHLQYWWGNPLMVERGKVVSVWAMPYKCHCGAPCSGRS